MMNAHHPARIRAATFTLAGLLLVACGRQTGDEARGTPPKSTPAPAAQPTPSSGTEPTEPPREKIEAIAQLQGRSGHVIDGTVRFIQHAEGVHVIADIRGLAPGTHGFHVHENGDCSAPDASSAGGHFDPTDDPHGGPKSERRHVGDLGNIIADAKGHGQLDYVDPVLRLSGPHSIIGRSVVVHAQRDDLQSQPAGSAGSRVACGVIQAAR